MNIEIILFGVIAFVLVLDFVLRGFKKKTLNEDIKKISDNKIENSLFSLNYFLARKRNFLTFILLTILLKPVFVFLFSPNYIEYIDYEQKIQRESFLQNKADLFNTFPSTAPLENPKAYYINDLPKFFYNKEFIKKYHIDSILPRYLFNVGKNYPSHNRMYKTDNFSTYNNSVDQISALAFESGMTTGDFMAAKGITYGTLKDYLYSVKGDLIVTYLKGSKPRINFQDGLWEFSSGGRGYYFDEITGEKKYIEVRPVLEFEKLPTKNEMLNCCNIHYDFNHDKFYDKNGNELFHQPTKGYGSNLDDFYFYPLIKKVDSFRNHFKEIFKSKLEYFGISLILLTLIIFLLNDRITAR